MKFAHFVCAWVVCSASYGQDFSKFQAAAGIGYAKADQMSGGSLFIEPMYRVRSNVGIGLQFEYATIGSTQSSDPSSTILSFSLNGRFYLSSTLLRPFVGAGLGTYYLSRDIIAAGFQSVNSFGWYPRLGFQYGHLDFIVEYTFISKQLPSTITIFGVPIGTTSPKDANYVGIKLGYIFGRGGTPEN